MSLDFPAGTWYDSCVYSSSDWRYYRDWDLPERWISEYAVPKLQIEMLFLILPKAIALAGPGSALLSYFVVGIFVYAVVISL